jgi:hypothetical protein
MIDAISYDRLYDYEKVNLLNEETPPPGRLVCKDTP